MPIQNIIRKAEQEYPPVSISGIDTSNFATVQNLEQTGSNLSTRLASTGANLQSQINIINNLAPSLVLAGGNTRGSNLTIGTNDDYSLRFETNNLAKMTILSSGQVGIGTTLSETEGADPAGLIVKDSIKTFNHGDSSQWNSVYNQYISGQLVKNFGNTIGIQTMTTGEYNSIIPISGVLYILI